MANALMNTYARLPISFSKGEGCTLWSSEGESYFDAISGIAVCNLGHCHPAITAAIQKQAAELIHTSNLFQIPVQTSLGEKLNTAAGMESVFFCNSGAEANEAAIKLARLHGHQLGYELPTVVVMDQSFHGRTMATLTATGNRKVHAGFEPLVQGFLRIPYNDINALKELESTQNQIAAILVEPIQGEGGVRVPEEDYLQNIREICDRNNWLMMLDEIQTGMGRTGKMFAFQHSTVKPDVMTLAKGLGNGMPIGACLAKGKATKLFQPGNHGTTFGGNPLACRTALTVLETLESEDVVFNAAQMGSYLLKQLQLAFESLDYITDIRGQGLIVGIEFDRPCGDLVKMALSEGVIINVTAERVVRLLPPLIVNKEEIDYLVNKLIELFDHFINPEANISGAE